MSTSKRCTKEDIEKWLEPLLKDMGFEEFTSSLEGTTAKGDGYLGDINFIKVSGKNKNGEDKVRNFVVKCGKKSVQLRDMMPVRQAFENEIVVYNKFLPALQKFQKDRNVKEPFNNFPKCYGTFLLEDMEVIVLENLKESNYALWDRTKPMTRQHVEKILKNYGKLHALSYAMKDQEPEEFKMYTEKIRDIFKFFNIETPNDDNSVKRFKDIIKLARERGEEDIVKKVMELEPKSMVDVPYPIDPFAVIVHGDNWNNNFMFKYEDEDKNKLSDVCFLDWQVCRHVSPVFDLSYFLFTTISEEDIEHFDQLMQIYYGSLSNFLRELGSDPDKLFPFEELDRQWKKYGVFGILMMPGLIKICLSDETEVTDLSEEAESGKQLTEMFSYSVKNIKEYERRTLPVIRMAMKKGFI